jgi:ribosomal protein S18 acetylase RimI-like enzyme
MLIAARVRTAHADAWAVEGALREPFGGGAATLRGIRVMASGVPHPQWNSADVTGPDADLEGARAFYAARGVAWGVRVPAGMRWDAGRHLFRMELMGLRPAGLKAAPDVDGVVVRAAGPADLDAVLAVDTTAFGSDPRLYRPWIEPHLSAPAITVALAELGGEPVGTAYSVSSDGAAGPAAFLAGVAVLEGARRRGVAAAMSAWLLERAFAAGVRLAHLHPDTDAAARIYRRLGFTDAGALDIYVDL